MKQRLLIVDDEPGIVDMMASYFSSQYEVLTAYCGNEALQKLARQPDLILLDINMPDIDGLTLCQKIRELITCPILFLTARVESADKIIGFQAGADDYIIKPFDLDELGARVAAHLRREQRHRNKATIRFFGELTIDYSARTVTVAGEPVALSKREFDIVELLSLNAGQVFDRERIYETVWGLDGEGNSDLNQISLTGGIPFSVSLPKAPVSIHADHIDNELDDDQYCGEQYRCNNILNRPLFLFVHKSIPPFSVNLYYC